MQTDMKASKMSQRSWNRFQNFKNLQTQQMFKSGSLSDFSRFESQFSDRTGKFVPKKLKKNQQASEANIDSKGQVAKAKIALSKDDQLAFMLKYKSISKIKRKKQQKNCNSKQVLQHFLSRIKDTLRLFNQIMRQLQMKLTKLEQNWKQSFLCTVNYLRGKVDQVNGDFFQAERSLCSNCLNEKLLNEMCRSYFPSPKQDNTKINIRASLSANVLNKGRNESREFPDLMGKISLISDSMSDNSEERELVARRRASQTFLFSKKLPQTDSWPRVNIFFEEDQRKVSSKCGSPTDKMNEIIRKMKQALSAKNQLIV